MVVKNYFYIQKLSFKLFGIDTEARNPALILKRPILCFVPLFFAISHVAAMMHYAYLNREDYAEVTDSLSLLCQSILSIWKLLLFLGKRRQFIEMINDIHRRNLQTAQNELAIIKGENEKDVKFCTLYFRMCIIALSFAFGTPIFDAAYSYYKTGELILRVPYKASYFLNHSQLFGYSLVYIWCALSLYSIVSAILAIDTTFTWLVTNIIAHFYALRFRCYQTAKTCSAADTREAKETLSSIKSCIKYHNEILQLIKELNRIYGEILFFKFLISCMQICFLAFRLSRPSESLTAAGYQCFFLMNVAVQLMLYCYNGQRITNESLQFAHNIYFAFDWTALTKSEKKLLLQAMMRAQKSTELKGIFFILDLNLFLWAFKTAGSLITALKTLDEDQ